MRLHEFGMLAKLKSVSDLTGAQTEGHLGSPLCQDNRKSLCCTRFSNTLTVARAGIIDQSQDAADVVKVLAQARHLGQVRLHQLGLDARPGGEFQAVPFLGDTVIPARYR